MNTLLKKLARKTPNITGMCFGKKEKDWKIISSRLIENNSYSIILLNIKYGDTQDWKSVKIKICNNTLYWNNNEYKIFKE